MHTAALAPVEAALTWCTPYIKGFALMAIFLGLAIQFGRQTNRHPVDGEYTRLSNMLSIALVGSLITFMGQAVIWDYFVESSPYRTAGLVTAGACFGIATLMLALVFVHALSWKRHLLFVIATAMFVTTVSMLADYAVMAEVMSIPQMLLSSLEVMMFISLALCLVAWAVKARTKQTPIVAA